MVQAIDASSSQPLFRADFAQQSSGFAQQSMEAPLFFQGPHFNSLVAQPPHLSYPTVPNLAWTIDPSAGMAAGPSQQPTYWPTSHGPEGGRTFYNPRMEIETLTPLGQVIQNGNVEEVRILLKKNPRLVSDIVHSLKSPLNHQLMRSDTPLTYALSMQAPIEILKILVELGANVNEPFSDTTTTPLIMAIEMNNIPAIKLLIENGADVNISTRFKNRALNLPDNRVSTSPLATAIHWNNPEAVELLLQNGAQLNPKLTSSTQLSPVQEIITDNLLTHSNRLKILSLLLKFGANPNQTFTRNYFDRTSTPLRLIHHFLNHFDRHPEYRFKNNYEDFKESIKILLRYGAELQPEIKLSEKTQQLLMEAQKELAAEQDQAAVALMLESPRRNTQFAVTMAQLLAPQPPKSQK